MARLEIELRPEEEQQLAQEARREGLSLPDYARRQLFQGLALAPAPAMPLWKRAAALGAAIPAQERASLPHDGSINYEHYLYHTPAQPAPEE